MGTTPPEDVKAIPNLNLPPNSMNRPFDHEKLEVYQESLAFVAWLVPLMEESPKTIAVQDQLDRPGASIVLNLAEGNGKFCLGLGAGL